MNEQVAESRRAWWERTGCVAAVVIALVILVVLAVATYRTWDDGIQAVGRSKGSDNLRSLGHLVRSDGYRALRSNLTGKAFVLGLLVADDPNWDHRFVPSKLFALDHVPDNNAFVDLLRRYRALTLQSLKTETNLGALTTHVGRAVRTDPEALQRETPIVADLQSVRDYALVLFADGSVGTMDRKALGLGPDDPIIAGPTSKSPLLRMLSPN